MASPAFIVFEGGEGSGKSTQARALARRLERLGSNVVATHEPGGTRMGQRLRRWLKWGRGLTVQTELLFFLASRSQIVTEVIRPGLDAGKIVICDRFYPSTFAYQGYGRGMDLGFIDSLNKYVTNGLVPDLIILLDLEVEEGLKRKKRRWDSFEREDFTFHQRVRDGYLRMAAQDPQRWLVVDACLPQSEIEERVWQRVKVFLTYRRRVVSPATSSL